MNNFLEETTLKIKGWFVTLTDVCASLGMDAAVFHRDNHLSNKLSSIFENCKVTVYVIESKRVFHFSNPGEEIMGNPWLIKLRMLPDWMLPGVLTGMDIVLRLMGTIEAIIRGAIKFRKNDHLIYNPVTGKFRLGFEHAIVYVSTSCIELLNNENELLSILLYELGWSTQIFFDAVRTIPFYIFSGYSILKPIYILYNLARGNEVPILRNLSQYMLFFLIYNVVIRTVLIYYIRRQRLTSDEFVIKCGYGDYYLSAMRKTHKYYEDIRSMASDNLNFVDKILILYHKLFFKFMQIFARLGISDVMKYDEREALVVKKNREYRENIRSGLVDRTAPINMTIPATAPVMKKLDSLHNTYIKPLSDKIMK